MKRTLILGILTLAIAGAHAQQAPDTKTPRVDRREAVQERRIEQGEKSGQLTSAESKRLEAQQGRVENAETKAQADGKVTAKERAHLDNMQDRSRANIAKQKHDRQRDMNHDGHRDRHARK